MPPSLEPIGNGFKRKRQGSHGELDRPPIQHTRVKTGTNTRNPNQLNPPSFELTTEAETSHEVRPSTELLIPRTWRSDLYTRLMEQGTDRSDGYSSESSSSDGSADNDHDSIQGDFREELSSKISEICTGSSSNMDSIFADSGQVGLSLRRASRSAGHKTTEVNDPATSSPPKNSNANKSGQSNKTRRPSQSTDWSDTSDEFLQDSGSSFANTPKGQENDEIGGLNSPPANDRNKRHSERLHRQSRSHWEPNAIALTKVKKTPRMQSLRNGSRLRVHQVLERRLKRSIVRDGGKEGDRLITEMKAQGHKWSEVHKAWQQRTGLKVTEAMIKLQYHSRLKGLASSLTTRSKETLVAPEDSDRLITEMKDQGRPWSEIHNARLERTGQTTKERDLINRYHTKIGGSFSPVIQGDKIRLVTSEEGDNIITSMKEQGQPWAVIHSVWLEKTGEKATQRDLINRFHTKLKDKGRRLGLNEDDKKRLLAAEADVEAEYQREKWNLVSEHMTFAGAPAYATPLLKKAFEQMMTKAVEKAPDMSASVDSGESHENPLPLPQEDQAEEFLPSESSTQDSDSDAYEPPASVAKSGLKPPQKTRLSKSASYMIPTKSSSASELRVSPLKMNKKSSSAHVVRTAANERAKILCKARAVKAKKNASKSPQASSVLPQRPSKIVRLRMQLPKTPVEPNVTLASPNPRACSKSNTHPFMQHTSTTSCSERNTDRSDPLFDGWREA